MQPAPSASESNVQQQNTTTLNTEAITTFNKNEIMNETHEMMCQWRKGENRNEMIEKCDNEKIRSCDGKAVEIARRKKAIQENENWNEVMMSIVVLWSETSRFK